MNRTPLPSARIDFGPDVLGLVAHPTRPWIALLRASADSPLTVEHHDLATGALVSVTEVPVYPFDWRWLGERIAVIARTTGTLSIDHGSGLVDVVYLPYVEHREAILQASLHPSQAAYIRTEDDHAIAYRVVQRAEGLAIEAITLTRDYTSWVLSPEGERWICTPSLASREPSYLVLGHGTEHQQVAFPPPYVDESYSVVGWLAPDAVLLFGTFLSDPEFGPCLLWRFDTATHQFQSLNVEIPAVWDVGSMALSEDGDAVALDAYMPSLEGHTSSIVVLDTETGVRCFTSLPHDRFLIHLAWLSAESLLLVSLEGETTVLLERLDLPTGTLTTYTLDSSPVLNDVRQWPLVTRIGGDRVMLTAPGVSHRCYVSAPGTA